MNAPTATPELAGEILDRLLRVRGTVQGVGFRPFVQRLATERGLHGWVRNDARGVLVRVIGDAAVLERFAGELVAKAPAAARVEGVDVLEGDEPGAWPPAGAGFEIAASAVEPGPADTAVPADLALCADCRRELLDPADRRHGYVFINCTQCGPRYSLIESLPYDRPRTTMRAFRMCPSCEREYGDAADRRFHAEPNACPACGPQLRLSDSTGNVLARRDAALDLAADALRAGRIVAVKSVGGFHLMCDAANDGAVRTLRARKHREEKPLAVMFPSLAALRAAAEVSAEAAALLESPAAPIVLVPRRADAPMAASVAPGNPWLGALLPYAPLQVRLLAAMGRALVATSANLSEEPLCTDDDEARRRLGGVADLFLGHDRPIARPVDDSVARVTTCGDRVLLRRARGYAPAPLRLPRRLASPVLCVGAQMKNAIAVAAEQRVVLSPHIGDLGNALTQAAFERTIAMLGGLHGAACETVVHDKHPDYSSTHYARSSGRRTIAVQHHLAHVLACLLEHGAPTEPVLGVAWDGTGYGEDGTIWGGEFILIERGGAQRFARLRPFRLPGGDAAVKDPRRVALAVAQQGGDAEAYFKLAARLGIDEGRAATFSLMVEKGLNSPLCSSAGRLFDAVGALLGLGRQNTFEGQTPLAVEAAAWDAREAGGELPLVVEGATTGGAVWEIDWLPLVRALTLPGAASDPAALAMAFHRGLAGAIAAVAREAGVGTVALTGGCFQNVLLHELASETLRADGFRVLVHRELSPNDGSIAAGQALGALWGMTGVVLP